MLKIPSGLRYAVFDLDNSLIEGRVASYIGKSYFLSQLYKLRLDHVYKGWKGARRVREILIAGGEEAETRGLEAFMGVLGETGIATFYDMYDYARRAVEEHALPGAKDFVGKCKSNGLVTQIVTLGLHVSAKAAVDYFEAYGGRGNPLIQEGETVRGIRLAMKTGEDRLREVRTIVNLEQTLVVGNDKLDWPLMEAADFSIAAPLADKETKGKANLAITDFRELELEPRRV